MADELDEFGIPIRKKKVEAKTQVSADVDEFGIPIKKKTTSEPLETSSPTSSTTSGTNYPVGSLPEAGQVENNQFGFPSTKFAGADPTIPATQLEDVEVKGTRTPKQDAQPQAPEEHWYNTFGAMLQAIPKSVYETVGNVIKTEENSLKQKTNSHVKESEQVGDDWVSKAKDYFKETLGILGDNIDTADAIKMGSPVTALKTISDKIINSGMSKEDKNRAIKELGKAQTAIQGRVQMMDEYAARNPYPQNLVTNTAVGVSGMLPDIALANLGGAGATGEVMAAKTAKALEGAPAVVAKYAPKAAALLERAVKAPFTKVMAAKGAAEGGAKNEANPFLGVTTGAIKGAGEGIYMHVLGEGAGKVSPYIAKVIGKTGATSEISTALANPLANAGVFTAAKAIRTPIEEGRLATADELAHEAAMGVGFSLLHAGQTFRTHQEANHFYENTLKTDPQESLGRVLNEKPENILRDYDPNLNVKDLTEARNELKEAIVKEPDLAVKKQLGDEALKIQNQLDAKEAVEGIVKDKDALIEMVDKLPELTPDQKAEYINRIDKIATDHDPIEVKKGELNNSIKEGERLNEFWSKELKNVTEPADRIEIEERIKSNEKYIERSTKELRDLITKPKEEIKPVEEVKPIDTVETTTQTEEVVTEPKIASNEEANQFTEQQVPKTEETGTKAGEESVGEDIQPKIGDTVEYNLNGEVFKGKLKAITPNDEYVVTKPDGTDYNTRTLQNFKPIGEVVAPETQTNKNIVEEAYKSNKEIESVGGTKQYDNYVKSIFPESQSKEPLYHGSPNEFENFDLGKLGENSKNTGYFGEGLYFTPKKSMADAYGDKTYRVVLDTKNPFKKTAKNFEDLYERLKDLGVDKKYFDGRALALITQAYPQHSKRITQAIKDMGYDSVVDWNETIVFDPKQVHILGTKNDASKFKEFVEGNETPVAKPKYTIKGETVTPKVRTVSSADLNKIGKAFSDRFGIGYEVISKEKANKILNLRSKKDIFFQILDDVDIFKNKNIEDSKAFVEKVFSTVESADDAKSAYKRLAGKFHPDRDGGSNEIMQYLNNAKDKYNKGGYKKTGNMYKDPIFKTYADHMNDLRNWANKKTKDFRDDLSPEDLNRFQDDQMAFDKNKKALKDNGKSAIEKINNQLKSDLEEIRDYVKSRKEAIRKRTDISEYKKGDLLADVDLKRSELEETYRNKAEEQIDTINNNLDDDLDKIGSDFDNKWSFQKKGDRIGGFYDKANKKAYLVEGVADETTAIHEMFSHPFISAVESEHPELFKNILNEAKNDSQIKEYVDANYGELEGLDRNHEYIAAAIDLESRNQLKNKSLIDYIDQFWKIIKDNISTIFGGKKVTGFDKNTNIKDIVDFILNSDESIDLKGKENVNTLNEPIVGGETKANAEDVQPTSNDKGGNGTQAETVAEETVKPSFDELATRSLEGDVIKNTLSNVERETNTKLDKNIAEYNAADFKSAFVQGEQTVQAAKEEFGKDYVSKFTDYVKDSKMPFENKAVMLVSLENDLRKQYLENPTPQLKKQVDLATKNSIEFLRSSARATGVGIFRQAARANYETEQASEAIFSPKERQERTKVEEAVQSTSEDVQKEYEARQETQTDTNVQEAIDKGVQARIDDIYEALPSSRKQAADKAISALERIQKKLRSKTYDASIGVPIAIIDAGISTIKQAIKAGVKVADAIELGINKIKEKYGKTWKNEDKFRKDMLDGFSDENIDIQDGTRTTKTTDKLKQELIDAGYGKEITVTTKNGKEKRNIIDWKKLTGVEGSFDRMKENLEESLKKKGYSEPEINEFQKKLEDEYNDIHADIIQKSLNELNRRNTPREATAKTLARRLAELYNLGLYDRDVDTYSNILNNALGISPKSQAAFNEIRDFNRSLAQLLDSRGVNGKRLTDLEIITAENEIKAHIQKVIQKVQFAEGNGFFKFSDVMKNVFSAMQRMMLAKVSQLVENPFSGALNDTQVKLQDAFSKGKWDTKELKENRAMLGRAIYEDASLRGGDEYGGVGNPFTSKNSIESFVNGLSKNAMYQSFVGMLSGRQYLDATDSYFKIKRTEKEFTNNLLRILTDKSNPNGAMEQNDALKFVSESLTGQSFSQAKETARGIIESINDKAGKEIIRPAETNVTRIANDLVKDNLVIGGKMTMNEVESAFKAAYKTAGKSIGHESNNLLTDVVNATNQTIQRKLDEALKKKDWSTAAVLNLTSILSKNIVNPFVGGGTNWTVISLQKMGLPTEWIRSDVGFSKKPIDLGTKEGLKELQNNLSANATRQRQFGRIMTGTLTALAAVMAVRYSGDEDDYKKWLKAHPDTRKLINKIQPVPLTLYLARDNKKGEFIKAIASTLGSRYNAQTDADKLYAAVNDFWEGYNKGNEKKTKKAWGTVGQLMGRRVNIPYVSSISNYGDAGDKLYKEFVGKPVKDPYKSPKGFVDGYFKGGLMDYLNITPQDLKEDKK